MKKKKKLILPKKIKVGGTVYDIIETNKQTEDENIGYHDGHVSTIMLSRKAFGDIRPDSRILETLLHEIFHAIDFVYCRDPMSEDLITSLSYSWFDFLVHNDLMLDSKKLPKKIRCRGFVYDVVYPACEVTQMDSGNLFSTTNHNALKIFIRKFRKESVYYIKAKFLYSIGNLIMTRDSSINEDTRNIVSDSAFLGGVFQVLLDTKLDKLIREWCKE